MSNQKKSAPYNGLYWIVEDATYLSDYRVKLWFRDGSIKVVDLKDELTGDLLEPLKDLELFRQVRFDEEASTITWPNGADLAPEFLYERGEEVVLPEVTQSDRKRA